MASPLVSIIVPVYNVAPYLRECFDSIVGQTYGNLEVIVVDDGSTDGCAAICDEYAEKDARFRVVHQPNRGLSAARNVGLNDARGEYISFIDSDDVTSSMFLSELVWGILQSNADVAQCGFSTRLSQVVSTEIGKPTFNQLKKSAQFDVITGREASERLQFDSTGSYTVVWNKLYRRYLFKNLRFPDGHQHEDEFVSYKIWWAAEKAAITNMRLYGYRQRSDSTMNKGFSRKSLDVIDALAQRTLFYIDKNEERFAILTDAVACFRLCKMLPDIAYTIPEELPVWINMTKSLFFKVVHSNQISIKKKIGLAVRIVQATISR